MTAEGGPLPAWLRPLRRWLFDPVPMHSMVICRIGLGSVLFLAYLSRWPLIDTIYGPDGFAGHAYFERFADSGPGCIDGCRRQPGFGIGLRRARD